MTHFPHTFTGDELHVISDALDELVNAIDRREIAPWRDYDGGDDDPKMRRDGYVALAFAAGQTVTRLLTGANLPLPPPRPCDMATFDECEAAGVDGALRS